MEVGACLKKSGLTSTTVLKTAPKVPIAVITLSAILTILWKLKKILNMKLFTAGMVCQKLLLLVITVKIAAQKLLL